MTTRRGFLGLGATASVAAVARSAKASSLSFARRSKNGARARVTRPGRDYQPVIVPSGSKVPFQVVDGVKVFHMTASEHEHDFAPGLKAICWGFNGTVNGPVIEAAQGDQVRIYITNDLPAPTTTHWHGFILPNGMDGVSGLTQPPIPPGETWV
jgi:FtsP/CotA-like multicopper oxidase with cupredoxin domain